MPRRANAEARLAPGDHRAGQESRARWAPPTGLQSFYFLARAAIAGRFLLGSDLGLIYAAQMLGYDPFSLPPRHLQVAVGVNFAVLFADGDFANVNHGGRDGVSHQSAEHVADRLLCGGER